MEKPLTTGEVKEDGSLAGFSPEFLKNMDAFLKLLGVKAKENGVVDSGLKPAMDGSKRSILSGREDKKRVTLEENNFRRVKEFVGDQMKFKDWNFDFF